MDAARGDGPGLRSGIDVGLTEQGRSLIAQRPSKALSPGLSGSVTLVCVATVHVALSGN